MMRPQPELLRAMRISRKAVIIISACVALPGCVGQAASDAAIQLGDTSGCIAVDASVAGYLGHAVIGHSGSKDNSTVTVGKDGTCVITRGTGSPSSSQPSALRP